MTQATLFDEPRIIDGIPVLLDVQHDLLERGRAAYRPAKRVIWQAPCGSGKTIVAAEQTRRATAMGKTVMHCVHRRRLVDQMIATLRKFGIHASPIMQDRMRWTSDVYCASRDTLLAMLKNGAELPRVDLIIWDECHTAADAVQQWYLNNCPETYWTGYTATPVYSNGRGMSPPYQALVCMAPTSKLLEIGRLCPVKVFNPDAIGRRRRKGDKVKPVGDPVDHWKKYANGLPTVVFAASVKDSQAIVQRYLDAGISAEHIDASTPENEREEVFERSRTGQTRIISNCGVLIEGVDLPWLVCCQILRGCNSLVLWIQATGRIMRASPGKEYGIVLDHSGAAHEFGLPDRDFQWTLQDEKSNEKANKLPKDRKPTTCPKCGICFMGKPACPECGHVLPKKRRQSLVDGLRPGDGVLTQFTDDQNAAINLAIMDRTWKQMLYVGRAKGWRMRQVLGMFKSKTGYLPWDASLSHELPRNWDIPVADWMRSQA